MTDKPKNPAAVALAHLARGVPKTLTPEQRAAKAATMRQNATGLWEKRRQRGTVHGKKQRDVAATSENICPKCGKEISLNNDAYFVEGKKYHKIAACYAAVMEEKH